jgi:hypothetical protein
LFTFLFDDSTEKRSNARRGPECGGTGCARTPEYPSQLLEGSFFNELFDELPHKQTASVLEKELGVVLFFSRGRSNKPSKTSAKLLTLF